LKPCTCGLTAVGLNRQLTDSGGNIWTNDAVATGSSTGTIFNGSNDLFFD
jgi:hypothetical protein